MAIATSPPPLPPVPSPRQLAWHALETIAFVHFGPNTFTGNEWGSGKERPQQFAPTALDCRQWTRAFKLAGFKGVILTAKHHDGFCLWPSRESSHTVAQSPFKGDVLRALADACRADGLKLGVYLSPWDRNHPAYGTPEYNQVFCRMLREVLTGYGPIFEVWFDGANGEGPNGKRQEYDWPAFIQVVRECQPNAVIFSDAGPDIRWVGNENGVASETNWGTLRRDEVWPGWPKYVELAEGHRDGTHWVPAECDVSIRPGWFHRASEDAKVKQGAELLELYYKSVGRGGALLLNVPPDSRGLIADPDLAALADYKKRLDAEFRRPVKPAAAEASDEFDAGWEASRAIDGKPGTAWAAKTPAASIAFRFAGRATFDRILLREHLPLGQRVARFHLEIDGKPLEPQEQTTTIGWNRILRMPPVAASAVTVHILEAKGPPILSEVAFYASPACP